MSGCCHCYYWRLSCRLLFILLWMGSGILGSLRHVVRASCILGMQSWSLWVADGSCVRRRRQWQTGSASSKSSLSGRAVSRIGTTCIFFVFTKHVSNLSNDIAWVCKVLYFQQCSECHSASANVSKASAMLFTKTQCIHGLAAKIWEVKPCLRSKCLSRKVKSAHRLATQKK